MIKIITQGGHLFFLGVWVLLKEWFEWICVAIRYYRCAEFLKADIWLCWGYLLISPNRVCQQYFIKQLKKEIQPYGETPLTTLADIVEKANIHPTDTVYELGCGRGRAVFWLATWVGCNVVGVDINPLFIKKANQVKQKLSAATVNFIEADFCDTDLNDATVIYLYGTCLEDQAIVALIAQLKRIPHAVTIITTSYALNEYCDPPVFTAIRSFDCRYPWGKATLYIQVKPIS